jgi:hypothetical protein
MTFHMPFDFYYWFVTIFAGSMTMFLTISFILIAVLAGMFRMPSIIVGIMFAVYIISLAAFTGNLVILIVILAGLIIAWSISRIFR